MKTADQRFLLLGAAAAGAYLWWAHRRAAASSPAVQPVPSGKTVIPEGTSPAAGTPLTMAPSQVSEAPSTTAALQALNSQPTAAAPVPAAAPAGPDAHQLHEEHLARLAATGAASSSPRSVPTRGRGGPVYMYDAVGTASAQLRQFNPMIVAGYNTGSGAVPWTAEDWARFPHALHVHIDQAGPGSPSRTAAVMDVEPGCFRPSSVPGWIRQNRSGNPTVYCDRNDLNAVLATGYKGPVWLAWPGWNGEPLHHQVVAVQSVFGNFYDRTTIIDPAWLAKGGGS